MKALSIKQPWLNWILSGRKNLETRTWRTDYRGPLLLCASLGVDKTAPGLSTGDNVEFYPRGYALGVAVLAGVWLMRKEDEWAAMCRATPRRYAWHLTSVKPIIPIPVKGRLGLFDVDVQPLELVTCRPL